VGETVINSYTGMTHVFHGCQDLLQPLFQVEPIIFIKMSEF